MPFGKYKGETLEGVIGKDPQYVYWCCSNIEGFHIHPDVRNVLVDSLEAHACSDLYSNSPDEDWYEGEWQDNFYDDIDPW